MRKLTILLLLISPLCIAQPSLKSDGRIIKTAGGNIFLSAEPFEYQRTIPNPVLWYDFTDLSTITKSETDLISKVTNKGTATDSATASGAARPLYVSNLINGLGGARFDGTDDVLTTSSINHGTTYTIFIAMKQPNSETGKSLMGSSATNQFNARKDYVRLILGGDSLYGYTMRPDGANLYNNYFSFRRKGVDFTFHERKNNPPYYFYNSTWVTSPLILKDIGGYSGSYIATDVYEILIYNVALRNSEYDSINDYLENKYALNSLPESDSNRILILGNSLTEQRVWCNIVTSHLRETDDWSEMIYAKSGIGTHRLMTTCSPVSQYTQYFWCKLIELYPKPKNDIVLLWEGTNSLISDGYTVAYTQGLIQAAYSQLKSLGYFTIAVTCLPFGDTVANPTYRPKRDSLNTWMRANWKNWADTLIDVELYGAMGNNGDQYNTTYYSSDKIHPTTTGQNYIANTIIIPVIDAIKEE